MFGEERKGSATAQTEKKWFPRKSAQPADKIRPDFLNDPEFLYEKMK